MFIGFYPLDSVTASLFANDVNPLSLYGFPPPTDVLTALVLDGLQSIFGHITSENFLLMLRGANYKHKNACCNTRKYLFWKFDYFCQSVILHPTTYTTTGFLQFVVWQDKCANSPFRYIVEHILNNIQTAVLVLKRRIHQHLRDGFLMYPPSCFYGTTIHMLKVCFSIFVNQHIGASQSIYFTVKLNTIKLSLGYFVSFLGAYTSGFFYHIAHRFYKESTTTTGSIKYCILLRRSRYLVHERSDVVWCKNLSRL